MAFIKRSDTKQVIAKVGKHMNTCSICKNTFVSNSQINICPNCISKTTEKDNHHEELED